MENKNPIQVAGRLFETLELLSENGVMGLTEISGALGLNKSTAHRVLNSLIFMGYVKQEEESGKYRPTFKIVDLAGKIMSKVDIVTLARPHLRKLMELAGETVHFVERDGTEAVYIDKVETAVDGIQMVSRIGRKIPLYCSGVGKAIAAGLPEDELRDLWNQSRIIPMTSHTITDYDKFLTELQEIRDRGYALDNEENEAGVRCIAASLNDHTGRPKYAFSISAPVSRMNDERITELSHFVLETKKQLERELHP